VKGFSLVEMMVTLVVMAIVLAFAVPSFIGLVDAGRLSSATNDLNAAVRQARSEAMRRGQRVTLCASLDGNQCSNNDWTSGWIMFVDRIRGANPNVDAGETVLQVRQGMTGGIVILGEAAVARFVSFSPDGLSRTMAGAAQSGTIRVCTPSTASGINDDNRARNLILNVSGQFVMQTAQGVNNNCPAP